MDVAVLAGEAVGEGEEGEEEKMPKEHRKRPARVGSQRNSSLIVSAVVFVKYPQTHKPIYSQTEIHIKLYPVFLFIPPVVQKFLHGEKCLSVALSSS